MGRQHEPIGLEPVSSITLLYLRTRYGVAPAFSTIPLRGGLTERRRENGDTERRTQAAEGIWGSPCHREESYRPSPQTWLVALEQVQFRPNPLLRGDVRIGLRMRRME